MQHHHADAILATLSASWVQGTPASEYPNSRCLGMAISDATGSREIMAEVEQQVRKLFPARVSAPRPLLPMFNCCSSQVIPAFNAHPDTSLADIRRVVTAAAG